MFVPFLLRFLVAIRVVAGAASGFALASPVLLLIFGGLKNSIDLDNHCEDQCEKICNWVDPCIAEREAFYASGGPYQKRQSDRAACDAFYAFNPSYNDGLFSCAALYPTLFFHCSQSSQPPTIVNDSHNPDQCHYCACDKAWIQIIYGVLEDYKPPDPDQEQNPDSDPSRLKNQLVSIKSCWVVVYSYDEDNKLTIKYNPGLNEDFLRLKALDPSEVDQDQSLDFNQIKDLTSSDYYKDSKVFNLSFWSAQKIDMECRKWQPGDLIPTK